MVEVPEKDQRRSGQCLCGAVRFSVALKTKEMAACHCSMCRRWSGGPFFAVQCEPDLQLENDTQLGSYASSEWGQRQFCLTCGTALFWQTQDGSHLHVSAQALEDPADFAFTSEIFVDEKPANYAFSNQTRKMTGAEVFALFAPDGNK